MSVLITDEKVTLTLKITLLNLTKMNKRRKIIAQLICASQAQVMLDLGVKDGGTKKS